MLRMPSSFHPRKSTSYYPPIMHLIFITSNSFSHFAFHFFSHFVVSFLLHIVDASFSQSAIGDMSDASKVQKDFQRSGMLSREQLLHLFSRFSFLTSQPDVKKRIADAVRDKQEAVSITTAIQDEILLEVGIDPRFGIACLGKVDAAYEKDMDMMIQFYRFITKEEMAIDEAELGPDEFVVKMHQHQKLQEQNMRRYHPDCQLAILENIHEQMASASFEDIAVILSSDQMREIARQRTAFRARKDW